MKKWFRSERALVYALVPIPYCAVTGLLFALTNGMERYLGWNGLLWQCLGALALTLYVFGPICFMCTGAGCMYHCVKKLRSREAVRKHGILLLVALVTIVASLAFFRWYWYGSA